MAKAKGTGWAKKPLWVVGGDGAMFDIGFQALSRMFASGMNIKVLVLDTQVYSNTGGQNSDSSTMLGGYDMNQFGVASQGKLIEKKNVALAIVVGSMCIAIGLIVSAAVQG